MNLQEDFCSQELYELLIDKGFEVDCYDAPFTKRLVTHQSAMKWLREVHKIYAAPMQQGNYDDNSIYYSYAVAQIIDGRSYIQRPMSVADKFTYEEAVEAAIKYALENLI